MKLKLEQAKKISEVLTLGCKEQRTLISLGGPPEGLLHRQNALNDAYYFVGELEQAINVAIDNGKNEVKLL
jgi:hypothetical protein